MNTEYYWTVTLSDGTVIKQFDNKKQNLFNLDWEKPGSIIKFELTNKQKIYSVNLKYGIFDMSGNNFQLKQSDKASLYFRRRNTITVNGNYKSKKIEYLFGYKIGNKKYIASIIPEEKIQNPREYI